MLFWSEVLEVIRFINELPSFLGPNNTRAMDNAMRYRRELKTGLVKTYEHIKADEEKMLTKAYMSTKLSKLCREETLRRVRFARYSYNFIAVSLVFFFLKMKDHLVLIQCYYRRKLKLN